MKMQWHLLRTKVNSIPLSYFKGSTTDQTAYRNITAEAVIQTDKEYMSATDKGNYGRNEYGERLTKEAPKMFSPYHAKSEYSLDEVKQHVLFLYELARRRIILEEPFSTTVSDYNGNSYFNIAIPQKMQRRIVVDLRELKEKVNLASNNNVLGVGYMIFGVFLHLVQDMQAHRAKVDVSMILKSDGSYYDEDLFGQYVSENHINGDNFLNKSNKLQDLKIRTQSSVGMPMIRLKDYLKENVNIVVNGKSYSPISAAGAYEDNPFFYSDRFSMAAKS